MAIEGYFIDSNLLLLFVAGRASRNIIAKHRRLQAYTVDDYEILLDLLDRVEQVFVTPHTLTETSNLLAQHGKPERSRLFLQLRRLIRDSKEVVVAGTDASNNRAFRQLGITDAALLEVISEKTPLLTVDLDLYMEAARKEPNSAINFNYLREF
ncbi:MAG: PIN domain-containing protein [Chloroflexi bacterium]|nr:PIN domain-containing protein [Chloroflexota bacterium]